MTLPIDQDWSTYERSDLVRKHYQTPGVAVYIPLLQAGVSGILSGVAAGTLAGMLKFYPFHVTGLAFVFVTLLVWVALQLRWSRLVIELEQALGVDLNRNGVIDQPEQKQTVRLEVKTDNGWKFAELEGVDLVDLQDLARGVLAGQTFSESSWTGSGRPFSRAQFRRIRDTFVARNWLEWKNADAPAQGLQLTPQGKAVCRYLSSPTLLSEVGAER